MISWSEEKPMRQLIDEIVLEGWMRMETMRINTIIMGLDQEVQRRLVENWLEKKAEEEDLLLTLKLEEERQKRLARIHLLKEVMKRKWDARKLQEILRMMRNMSIEDLEMELEEVEARAIELMDMDVMDMDVMEESDVSEMSVLEDGPGGEWVATTLPSGSEISISGDYQPGEDYRQENTRGGSNISIGWRGDME